MDELKAPRQAALAGADQQQMHLILAGAGRAAAARRANPLAAPAILEITASILLGIGTRRFGGGLRAAQLRGRHHLHGLGDLLRRLGGGDADPHVFQ